MWVESRHGQAKPERRFRLAVERRPPALPAAIPGVFLPPIATDIDWGRGYEALDKEFQQIIRRAKVGKGLADKLFKVWVCDGGEHWLLINVEIQGAVEKNFPERMFRYWPRIRCIIGK
jgi:hypothetical protein